VKLRFLLAFMTNGMR